MKPAAMPDGSGRCQCAAHAPNIVHGHPEAAAGIGLALRYLTQKIAFNRRMLYIKPQKIPISSPRLASPIKLGLALS